MRDIDLIMLGFVVLWITLLVIHVFAIIRVIG